MLSLSNAGKKPFKKAPTPLWNEGKSVLEINEKHFVFSNQLCKDLNITDDNILTLIYDQGTIYLCNITSKVLNTIETRHETDEGILLRSECLHPSKERVGKYKGARTAANKGLFTAYEKRGLALGEYELEIIDNSFPAVKILLNNEPVDTSVEEVVNANEMW